MKRLIRGVLMVLGLLSLVPSLASATWTPLIVAADFTGINTDLLTAIGGMMSLIMIVVGVGILISALRH
jgi:hypothetical protein